MRGKSSIGMVGASYLASQIRKLLKLRVNEEEPEVRKLRLKWIAKKMALTSPHSSSTAVQADEILGVGARKA